MLCREGRRGQKVVENLRQLLVCGLQEREHTQLQAHAEEERRKLEAELKSSAASMLLGTTAEGRTVSLMRSAFILYESLSS
jgi:hypothetical protein